MTPGVQPVENRLGRSAAAGSWQPLLDGLLREQTLEAVSAIADAVRAAPLTLRPGADSVSLAGGTLGLAVSHAYLERAGLAADVGTAERLLDSAMTEAAASPLDPSLYGGLTGLGWATEHLRDRLTETDADGVCGEIDESLGELLLRSPWRGDYDLIRGLVGFGVYALERLPRPAAAANLEHVIDRLAESAEEQPDGLTWWTDPARLPPEARERAPRGYYDLGLAHGVPGVIALLGRACAAGVAVGKARPLLGGAARWLLARQPADGSGFGSHVEPGTMAPTAPARLAWCYGDLGIAAALLGAARCVAEPAWERAARAAARRAAARPPEQSGVRDAGLCHGSAGAGHLFNRLYQATGDEALAAAARFWFRRTLELRQPGRGVAGFVAHRPPRPGQDGGADDPGLLEGAAGVALALLAATTSVEPTWDRMMLTAIPPGAD
jgi:hypothetical protein